MTHTSLKDGLIRQFWAVVYSWKNKEHEYCDNCESINDHVDINGYYLNDYHGCLCTTCTVFFNLPLWQHSKEARG